MQIHDLQIDVMRGSSPSNTWLTFSLQNGFNDLDERFWESQENRIRILNAMLERGLPVDVSFLNGAAALSRCALLLSIRPILISSAHSPDLHPKLCIHAKTLADSLLL